MLAAARRLKGEVDALRDAFDRDRRLGQLTPTGKALAVEGGYGVSGRLTFGSGIGHSEWTLGICAVHDGELARR